MIDPAAVAKLLPKKDSTSGKVKIKKAGSKLKVEANGELPGCGD